LFVMTPVALLDIAASPARPRLDRLTRRLLEQCLLRLTILMAELAAATGSEEGHSSTGGCRNERLA